MSKKPKKKSKTLTQPITTKRIQQLMQKGLPVEEWVTEAACSELKERLVAGVEHTVDSELDEALELAYNPRLSCEAWLEDALRNLHVYLLLALHGKCPRCHVDHSECIAAKIRSGEVHQ